MPTLITNSYKKYYNASLFSVTTLVTLCIIALMIMLPIFIGNNTGSISFTFLFINRFLERAKCLL